MIYRRGSSAGAYRTRRATASRCCGTRTDRTASSGRGSISTARRKSAVLLCNTINSMQLGSRAWKNSHIFGSIGLSGADKGHRRARRLGQQIRLHAVAPKYRGSARTHTQSGFWFAKPRPSKSTQPHGAPLTVALALAGDYAQGRSDLRPVALAFALPTTPAVAEPVALESAAVRCRRPGPADVAPTPAAGFGGSEYGGGSTASSH